MTASQSGCLSLKLKPNQAALDMKTHTFVKAIACEGLNQKYTKHTGITMPPPPIPAALETARTTKRTTEPIISFQESGKTSLCTHSPAGTSQM